MSSTIAITYRRVSSFKQERDGVSLEVQTDQCLEYIRRQRGWRLGGDFQDTLTGRTAKRPQYQAMLAEVRQLRAQGQNVVVVCAALDRMGRDLGESVRARRELKQLAVPLHCIREGGELQEMQADILASVAADESRRIGARVRGSHEKFRRSGFRSTARAPWGYTWAEATERERLTGSPAAVLRIDPATADFAREAWERAAGGETVHQVTRWVASLPSAARGGRVLRFKNVLFVLKNPSYIARVEDPERGIVVRYETDPGTGEQIARRTRRIPTPDLGALSLPSGRWEALVTDETWIAVHQRLAGHKTMPRQAKGQHLLSGFLRCMRCGMRLQGRQKFGGTNHRAYSCATPARGCTFTVRASVIEAATLDAVAALVTELHGDAALMAAIRRKWARLQRPPARADAGRAKTLQRVITKARKRQDEALGLLADRVIDRAKYQRFAEAEQSDIDAAQRELAAIKVVEAPPTLPDLDDVLRDLGGWSTVLATGPVPRRRDVLARLIETVVPIRVGYGKYKADITWTPLGTALHALANEGPPEADQIQ